MNVFTSSILSMLVGLVLFTSCNQIEAQKTDATAMLVSNDGPSLHFEASEFDFGKIKQGDVVNHEFTFVNNGSEPVIIERIKTACGCTVGDYKKEPILPGESSIITAKFNSKGKSGKQRKTLSVFTNISEEPLALFISGEIEAVKKEQTAQNQ